MLKRNSRLLVLGVMCALVPACSTRTTLDTSFGNTGIVTTPVGPFNEAGIQSVALQGDGKIVVAGYCKGMAGDSDIALARYNPDGSLDTSFDGDGRAITSLGSTEAGMSVAIQNDGKIVVVGYTGPSGSHDFAIARYTSDGFLDPTFGGTGVVTTSLSTGNDEAMAVAMQADGKIVVAGTGADAFELARYLPNGNLDPAFGNGGVATVSPGQNVTAFGVAIQPDGRIVVAGGSAATVLVRYMPDGKRDPSFNGDGIVVTDVSSLNDQAHSLAIQADGHIVVGGYHKSATGDDFAILRYKPNGSLDNSFGSGGIVKTHVADVDDWAYAVVVQPDGKVIAAGGQNGSAWGDIAITRYNTDGSLDKSYGNAGVMITHIDHESLAQSAALQADGKLVVAGQLIKPGGTTAGFVVVRYSSDRTP